LNEEGRFFVDWVLQSSSSRQPETPAPSSESAPCENFASPC